MHDECMDQRFRFTRSPCSNFSCSCKKSWTKEARASSAGGAGRGVTSAFSGPSESCALWRSGGSSRLRWFQVSRPTCCCARSQPAALKKGGAKEGHSLRRRERLWRAVTLTSCGDPAFVPPECLAILLGSCGGGFDVACAFYLYVVLAYCTSPLPSCRGGDGGGVLFPPLPSG